MYGAIEHLLRDYKIDVSNDGVLRDPCVSLWLGFSNLSVRIINFGVEVSTEGGCFLRYVLFCWKYAAGVKVYGQALWEWIVISALLRLALHNLADAGKFCIVLF